MVCIPAPQTQRANPGLTLRPQLLRLINTEEYEPYDLSTGTLKMEVTAVLASGRGPKTIGRCELWLISRDKMA